MSKEQMWEVFDYIIGHNEAWVGHSDTPNHYVIKVVMRSTDQDFALPDNVIWCKEKGNISARDTNQPICDVEIDPWYDASM